MPEWEGSSGSAIAWQQWKKHSPLLYDLLISHNLPYPSPCFRWGHIVNEESSFSTQRIYYSERGASPNAIVVANAKIAKPRNTDPMKIDKWDELSQSPQISILFKIETPEKTEVNKIYTCEQHNKILVAKSDLSSLHLYDIGHNSFASGQHLKPIATLSGHGPTDCESNFALDTSSAAPKVLSGDKSGVVLMWDIEGPAKAGAQAGTRPDVAPSRKFEGHDDTVEDVCFKPESAQEFCSVGDDQLLLFWDIREKSSPVQKVPKWCNVDLHCVDWNPRDMNLIVTGTADGATFVFDRRKIEDSNGARPLHKLHKHEDSVYRVAWLPQSTHHFASGGDDNTLCVWDLSRVGQTQTPEQEAAGPPEVIFKHSGHRGSVQDLQWNPHNPWVVGSVSEDSGWAQSGGTMQIWRPLDLLYKSEEECLMEVEKLQNDTRGTE